jgi:hypothetical protein
MANQIDVRVPIQIDLFGRRILGVRLDAVQVSFAAPA